MLKCKEEEFKVVKYKIVLWFVSWLVAV